MGLARGCHRMSKSEQRGKQVEESEESKTFFAFPFAWGGAVIESNVQYAPTYKESSPRCKVWRY